VKDATELFHDVNTQTLEATALPLSASRRAGSVFFQWLERKVPMSGKIGRKVSNAWKKRKPPGEGRLWLLR